MVKIRLTRAGAKKRPFYRIIAIDRHYSAASKIQFTTQERLAALMGEVGLGVDEWLSDWEGGAYEPKSREIIPVGGLPQHPS